MGATTAVPNRLENARRLLALSAWLMVLWIAIGFVSTIPAVDRFLTGAEQSNAGGLLVRVGLALIGLTALVMWAAALRYAWLRQREAGAARSFWPLVVLVVGSFVASFLYYFGWVLWKPSVSRTGS